MYYKEFIMLRVYLCLFEININVVKIEFIVVNVYVYMY